jgi:hypothetical protein
MSMKLLPASSNLLDSPQAPDVSTSLVPLTQRAITTRPGQMSLVPSGDAFARSSSTRRSEPNLIYGTPVEDSESDAALPSRGEYVSGWAWSRPVEKTAVAHCLSYAASPARWRGWLINLYA